VLDPSLNRASFKNIHTSTDSQMHKHISICRPNCLNSRQDSWLFFVSSYPSERVNYSTHNTERDTRQQLQHSPEKVLSASTKIAEFLRTRSIRPTAAAVRRPNDCRTRESRNRTLRFSPSEDRFLSLYSCLPNKTLACFRVWSSSLSLCRSLVL
jgi:hypothetical protein